MSLTNRPRERAERTVKTMINTYLSNVYSEELFTVSEAEHDEVMAMLAAESEGFAGYGEWSAALDHRPSIENFIVENGKVRHKPEPRSLGRINGYEL